MLKSLFLMLFVSFLFSCAEGTSVALNSEFTEAETQHSKRTTTLTEFCDQFPLLSELPTLESQNMDVSLILNKASFQFNDEPDFLSTNLVHDWIYPYFNHSSEGFIDNNWKAILMNDTEFQSLHCLAQIKDNDISVYLLKLNKAKDELSELNLLGNIGTVKYKDTSSEEDEKYDFEITECEDLIIEIKGDSLFTKCIRYSATVGKDWRIDQNLYVNDTVKLPIIENSYSLY